MAEHANRLAAETSPYLLQHAHNPVDWYPWGEEALARARAEDKPILLSIGYAACHWCHVMERESFENDATAALMNEHFVNVKVDREERPDIDEIYMAATVAMSGGGGWPMTLFLTPDQKPFFAGTYFPPADKYGRPGFPTLLTRVAELWRTDRESLLLQAGSLLEQVQQRAQAALPRAVGQSALDGAFDQLRLAFDPTHGGFGAAPKFPPSMALELLLRHHRRTGNDLALMMVKRTLDGMAAGGMRDHVGGGFARYSVDERWLVPHFEKMLYDNALLARVYAEAFAVTGDSNYERVVRETLDYVLREMTCPDGMFYSATDADSEGVEGKFFVWTPQQVQDVLAPADARAFCAYYDVTAPGNWEGVSVVNTPSALAEVAADLDLSEEALEGVLAEARAKLYAARQERVPPLLDDKILTSWNGLMIGAMAEAGRILNEPRYRAAAVRAADAIWDSMRRPDGGLFRTRRGDKVHLQAYLEDYAYLCDAFVDAYEASGAPRLIERAGHLADRLCSDFLAEDSGGFFATAHDHEALIVRMREGQDGAIPSANAVAARALARLSWHLGSDHYRTVAERAVRAHGKLIERAPRAFAASLRVIDLLLEGPAEVVVSRADGAAHDAPTAALLAALSFLPNRIIVHHPEGAATHAADELVAGKTPIDGQPTVYLCRNFACAAPATSTEQLVAQLAADRANALAARASGLSQRLEGHATADGTARYAARHDGGSYRSLGATALTVSAFGFGAYRVDDQTDSHRQALCKALEGGCNLIDTSTNYTEGSSERLVGGVVGELCAQEKLARDEIVVVSKIGYAQGANLRLAKDREADGKPFDEMVRYSDGCWHCIHESFLADQLERSLDRLGLATLDVCLLHNPEYFFSDAAKHGVVDEATRDVFYDRLRRAFAYLETQVEAGRIGCYGVSSNSVASPPDEDDATDLQRMLDAAQAAGGAQNHFRVLQLPLNLIECHGAATVVPAAAEAGLAVLANRPLNAIVDGALLRIADAENDGPDPGGSFAELIAAVRKLEARYAANFAESTATPLDWATQLGALDGKLGSVQSFGHVVFGQILPQISRGLSALEQRVDAAKRSEWVPWRKAYIRAVESSLAALRVQAVAAGNVRLAAVRSALDEKIPLTRHREPLVRKALWALRSLDGLSVTLLGMRREKYVDDAFAVMSWPKLTEPFSGFAP